MSMLATGYMSHIDTCCSAGHSICTGSVYTCTNMLQHKIDIAGGIGIAHHQVFKICLCM